MSAAMTSLEQTRGRAPDDPAAADGPRRVPTAAEIARWNEELQDADPDTILRFAAERFGARLAVATQFGVEGCTLLHRVARLAPQAYVFTIDTELLFRETYELANKLEQRLGITIHREKPDYSVGVQAAKYGPNLWEKDPDLCCTVRKVMPMQRTLERFDAWVTSVRREQTQNRADTPVVAWDAKFNLVKIAPLAAVTAAEIQRYVEEHDIPVNPLRLYGYQSIGCMPCTRPVAPGEDPRAGRWWKGSKTECGLHTR